jgi:protein involved in polysaccharide export with SLBB domain
MNRQSLALLFAFSAYALFAQTDTSTESGKYAFSYFTEKPDSSAAKAMNLIDYPVTPGDIYKIQYMLGPSVNAVSAQVNLDYTVAFPLFGTIDGKGKTYQEFVALIAQRVNSVYPKANPSVRINTVGVFSVFRKGEVNSSEWIDVYGYNRLYDVVNWQSNPVPVNTTAQDSQVLNITTYLTPRASIRNVIVRSFDKTERQYDLYKFKSQGDISQNPYLKPGDSITFMPAKKIVKISGEVSNAGTYELLAEENYRELIQFAGGYSSIADKSRITISRNVTDKKVNGEIINVDLDSASDVEIRDLDVVTVNSKKDLMPTVYIEGAISNSPNTLYTDGSMALNTSTKLTIPLYEGETLSMLMRERKSSLLPVSDLKTTYLIRGDERIYFSLENMIFSTNVENDISLKPNDKIIIPYRQFFVTVAGAVASGGRFPYVPDRDWHYYINLAGGINTDLNTGNVMTITDRDGKKKTKNDLLQPEDRIYVESNSFLYILGKVTSVFSSLLSAFYYGVDAYNIIHNLANPTGTTGQ